MAGVGNRSLIAVIGDEDTITGLLLAGIGHVSEQQKRNFLIVDSKTQVSTIESAFQEYTERKDIAILLINQHVADKVRPSVDNYQQAFPALLEIPSKDHPYATAADESSLNIREEGFIAERDSYSPPLPVPTDALSQRAASVLSHQANEYSNGVNDRASRRRSIMDPRHTRFSGFISNLIRRDRDRDSDRQDMEPDPDKTEQVTTTAITQPSSSMITPASLPAPRPTTPPPSLPPPTLHELGLSLSVLTANLSPSHLTTPPTSGTFLSPCYLLLCHAQGLDVLPLKRPPAPQPFALVRRVPFKSVVIMEERGVMVAIAGRRDGVRVYALEEVKKAIEWRMDFEIRKEIERNRREDAKRRPTGPVDNIFAPIATSDPKLKDNVLPPGNIRKMPSLPVSPLNTASTTAKNSSLPTRRYQPKPPTEPSSPPPQYVPSSDVQRPPFNSGLSAISIYQNSTHRTSAANLLDMPSRRNRQEEKPDGATVSWAGGSDDEAIDIVAAGPSGSAALDERTSIIASSSPWQANTTGGAGLSEIGVEGAPRSRRPSSIDLSEATALPPQNTTPSPTLTLSSIRQTLSRSRPLAARAPIVTDLDEPSDTEPEPGVGGTSERISFAQALLESRLPNIPPPGTRQAQLPVLISASHPVIIGDEESTPISEHRPQTASSITPSQEVAVPKSASRRSERFRRRRWTVLDGVFNTSNAVQISSSGESHVKSPVVERRQMAASSNRQVARTASQSSLNRSASARRGETSTFNTNHNETDIRQEGIPSALPSTSEASRPASARTTASTIRFIPRIFTNALNNRRSDDTVFLARSPDEGTFKRNNGNGTQSAAPKLEYVKLPGTKSSIMIKAVETARKSFLAILCGENGEKIELFAGTYRTALGLSRTFILPDSPRNIELQLQGDDLVEVFLVFSHNVFGLEPATVRVREVRIGRAERRAARRRARGARNENESQENDFMTMAEDDNIPVSLAIDSPETILQGTTTVTDASIRPNAVRQTADTGDAVASPAEPIIPAAATHNPDDLVTLAAAQIGSYTTFQQLSFAPTFPLAAIADEWIIPPTYPKVLQRYPKSNDNNNAPSEDVNAEEQQVLPPPGLPMPLPSPPSKWYYKDPKGIVRGPWKASLMQSWYKDGYLPLDLPVRRENETEYITLQDLRLRSVDPNCPFKGVLVSIPSIPLVNITGKVEGPLLNPISLLAQPKHYGPPALFFSSRGGHSTSIVDVRGRSVLKGRFFWSMDDDEGQGINKTKLGDITRIEAFDVETRAIIVALRQGGLEVVDVADAILSPADESREALPDFQASPANISRRGAYTWRIGSPVSLAPVSSLHEAPKTAITLVRKKQMANVATMAKAPAKSEGGYLIFDDSDNLFREEIIFLGRKDDNVYFCERNIDSFRILRLAPLR
ncbi:hypothetical protein Clacol_003692 [Clathrus columnatus]|uniref:V-type proton ATPase subunit F n=1 Tax=Clathrus columnatus TaxID=1419009 RepID=A0AAV5A896_9AGAM|nr:hypothetical protein Clacol_003692 [Clathrus columnatus]